MFAEADLTASLSRIGSRLGRKISAYLIGGCAMTLMGRKVSTKDIDIVFSSTDDARDFMAAAQSTGFEYVLEPTNEYNALGASAIMEDSRGMRFDIFDRQVCRALELSKGMKSRARLYRGFGNLDVYLMSPEDIFLFKGITERETDLDDMRILAEVGLNWQTVKSECLSQKKSGRWAYMLSARATDPHSFKYFFGVIKYNLGVIDELSKDTEGRRLLSSHPAKGTGGEQEDQGGRDHRDNGQKGQDGWIQRSQGHEQIHRRRRAVNT